LCALKLLNYLSDESILVVHDFWSRLIWTKKGGDTGYHHILDYYDVIGRARSSVALRKKRIEEMPAGWETAYIDITIEGDK
jgi:hypothetical protein